MASPKALLEDVPNSVRKKLINEWIHDQRNRNIMMDRWIDGLYYCELAEKYGITERQAQNVVYKCQNTIFKRM